MILVVTDLWVPFPGGAERLIFNLARELYRAGEPVQVLTGYERALQFDGPPLEVASIETPQAMRAALAEYRDAEVVLTHHYWASLFEEEIFELGLPVVQIVLNGRRLPRAAFAVFISEWVRAQLEDQPGDLTMVPPAFADVVAEEHGGAIGFVKPIPHKGVELVYRIAEALPERRFVILRGEWQDIEVIAEHPNIEFMEPVESIAEFYSRCRLVLMPSLSEDAGTVAQECALNGIPCISSSVGGLPETNAGGVVVRGHQLEDWLAEIRALDDGSVYAAVVGMQRRYTPTRQPEKVAAFVARVRSLR